MLQNRVYCGEITHKGASYPGEHQGIVEEALFDQVQSILATNRTDRLSRSNQDQSPLTGVLFDAEGECLAPTYALKKGVRYRYYVSRHLITGDKTEARGMRLPALGMTRLVRLAFLAPDITASILSGRHDPNLTASQLMAKTRFPIDWNGQRRSFASA
jgi:site-specific DNA recombinase